jgi:hypothetical protein
MTGQASVLRIASSPSKDEWQAVYQADPLAMPTQSPSWAAAIVAHGRYCDASRLYEFADSQRALLPLFVSRPRAGAFSALMSPPFAWGFGGLIATAPLSAHHIRAVLSDLTRQRMVVSQIRPNPLLASVWREAMPPEWTTIPRLSHVLNLARGFDEVWTKRFSAGTRHRVRRAERAGLEVESGSSTKLISEFHMLLQRSFERFARLQHEPTALARWRGLRRDPEEKFISLGQNMGSAFRLWVARLKGEPVASILVLIDREAHYTRAAMNRDLAAPNYANYLLQSLAIREACEAGCRHYHMGETGSSETLAQFKEHFGATPRAYAECRFERLPIHWAGEQVRRFAKLVVGFRDA